jgi:hypothetical protein
MKIGILVFGGVGAILLAIDAFWIVTEQNFLHRAATVTGTVVDMDMSDSSYCPKIDFTAPDGTKVLFFGNMCSSPPAYNIGDHVQLLMGPKNPKNVQMKNFWGEYTGPLILMAVGLPFLLAAVWISFANLHQS